MKGHDLVFMKHFAQLIAGMAAFTVLLILFAIYLHGSLKTEESGFRDDQIQARIQPLASYHSGDSGRLAILAAQEAARAAAAARVEFGGSVDGELIYNQVCAACHNTGTAGAPKLVRAEWGERLEQSEDLLLQHVIQGLGAMPPRGGRPGLTDEQVAASVDYMLANLD